MGGGGGGGEAPAVNVEKVEVAPPVATETETPIGLAPLRTAPVYTPGPTSTSDYSNPIPQYQPAQATDFGGLTLADLYDYGQFVKSNNLTPQQPSSSMQDLYDAYYRATGRKLGQ